MGIKKNFAYSSILTFSGYIFPLVTFPYISRVLGVTNVGVVYFVDSIINYAVLFSMMGLSVIGIREIANSKRDKKALTETFSNLFTLNLIATAITVVALVIAILFVPKLHEHWKLMCIGLSKLVFNLLLIEWFFKGLADFKYITIRSLIIKIIFVAAVFLFVKKADDYEVYFFLLCALVVLNAVINWWYKRRFVSFDFGSIKMKKYYKPFLIVGLYALLTSMYTTFNVSFLGFVASGTEVGYYTTATKLYAIILSVFTAFSGVMLPRISELFAEDKVEEIKCLLLKGFDFLLAFSVPVIVWTIIFAPEIVGIIAGKGYEGAVVPMRIVMPLVFIIGIEQILVTQILMPFKADKSILINSIIGATVGIIANMLLVKHFLSVGSSMVWVVSELAVLVASYIAVRKLLQIKVPVKNIVLNFLCGGLFFIVCLLIQNIETINDAIKLLLSGVSCVLIVVILQLYVFKNEVVLAMVKLN